MIRLYATGMLVVSFFALNALGQGPTANRLSEFDVPPRVATQQLIETYRLGFSAFVADARVPGLRVANIDANSPTRNMRRVDAPNIRGILEQNDLVTHVNGTQIRNLDEYYSVMDQSGGADVTLSIVDVQSNRPFNWIAKPIKVIAKRAKVPQSTQNRIAHVRLIGLTDDESIGESVQVSLNDLRLVIESAVPADRLDLKVLSGSECSFQTVMNDIKDLRSTSNSSDSLFVYYMGHGAYDPRYGSGDPSNGHFFQMPRYDLLRRQIYENMLTVPARLHGLVSDTCNVRGEATIHMIPFSRYAESRTMTLTGPSNIEQLLLYHSGEIDVSSTSQDQFGWASKTKGMFFSIHFGPAISGSSNWETVFDTAGRETSKFFKEVREYARSRRPSSSDATPDNIRNWQFMQNQSDMTPAPYRMSVQKDRNIETRPERTVEVTVWVMADERQ